jgi:hypothetical protein
MDSYFDLSFPYGHPSFDQFDTHVSNLRENFFISDIGGHPIQPDKQVDILKESLIGHPTYV